MRLIDADALIQDLTKWMKQVDQTHPQEVNAIPPMEDIIVSTIMTIEEQPTIEERKKGKWISLDDFRGKYNTWGYKCSECGEHSEYEENYCPNCGADMGEK